MTATGSQTRGAPVTQDPEQLLARIRREQGRLHAAGLHIRLAGAFGFCQGVRRAVEQATRAAHRLGSPARPSAREDAAGPAGRLHMTGEIIHNPSINERLEQAGIHRLPPPGTPERLAAVRSSDRVIIPAFGIELGEEGKLQEIGCEVIDTTCGWVRKVWRAVREFSAQGLTVIIHGRVEHEETRATASRVRGAYVIVRDRGEALRLADLVSGRLPARQNGDAPVDTRQELFARWFAGRHSHGFDPERDLERLGLVNQTTMLSSETAEIAAALRAAIGARTGAEPGRDRFRTLDTFCPATQERQDAVRELLAEGDVDVMIVVGGFRSSNTAHLALLAAKQVSAFHVEDASCLIDRDTIRHLPSGEADPVVVGAWLPARPCTIGITAGASTPDRETGRVIQRLLELHGGPRPAQGSEPR